MSANLWQGPANFFGRSLAGGGSDVCVNASYCGVLPARFIGEAAPRGAIRMDCGVGPEGYGPARERGVEIDMPVIAPAIPGAW